MFLIDDLLTAPGKAVLLVFEELARKAQEELLDDESVKRELQEIYNLLSSGKISEAEFEGRENGLLERLEQIAKLKFQSAPGADAMTNTATFHESAAEEVLPQSAPVIESQFDIACLGTLDSQDVTSRADVLETLRSLSQLFSPASSDATTDERIIDSREINSDDQTDTVQPIPAAVAESVSSSPRPIQPRQAPVATTPAPSVASSAPKTIQMSDAVDIALRTLTITRLKVSSIINAAKADDGWRVGVELVERAAVPDTGDLLGIYEVQLNHTGDVTRYERMRLRRRNDLR
jgi:hypothetical protein